MPDSGRKYGVYVISASARIRYLTMEATERSMSMRCPLKVAIKDFALL
jgi:hypothetical protein